jgi:hypothetical protein
MGTIPHFLFIIPTNTLLFSLFSVYYLSHILSMSRVLLCNVTYPSHLCRSGMF